MTLPTIIEGPSGPTIANASPSLLVDLLRDYVGVISAAGASVERHLGPGLPPEVIRRNFAAVGLVAPDEVVAWFSFWNGVEAAEGDEVAPDLFPKFQPLSLERALHFSQTLFALGTEPWEWDPSWVRLANPVLSLAVDCAEAPDRSPRVRFITEEHMTQPEDTRFQGVSLCTVVTLWIESIESGRYTRDSRTGGWVENRERVDPIAWRLQLA